MMYLLFGAPAENRTPDTMIKSHVLYRLSYRGIDFQHLDIITHLNPFVNTFLLKNTAAFRAADFYYSPYLAPLPSKLSICKSLLYFATLSLRHGAPVFIKRAFVPTAISAIVVSSVSPER